MFVNALAKDEHIKYKNRQQVCQLEAAIIIIIIIIVVVVIIIIIIHTFLYRHKVLTSDQHLHDMTVIKNMKVCYCKTEVEKHLCEGPYEP